MKPHLLVPAGVVVLTATVVAVVPESQVKNDSVAAMIGNIVEPETEIAELEPDENTVRRLTEQDFIDVAQELDVDVASVKAVIEIEAGKTHEGFAAPGQPVINFDLSMFRRFAAKHGVNLANYSKSHPAVFSRGGNNQNAVFDRFKAAETINRQAAIEGTFWGMFQIGGFNWEKCGAKNIDDFVRLMSRSERDQLELFAQFIINSGLQKPLQQKNWTAFARGYNGPRYARRGYHTRLAAAYKRHSVK